VRLHRARLAACARTLVAQRRGDCARTPVRAPWRAHWGTIQISHARAVKVRNLNFANAAAGRASGRAALHARAPARARRRGDARSLDSICASRCPLASGRAHEAGAVLHDCSHCRQSAHARKRRRVRTHACAPVPSRCARAARTRGASAGAKNADAVRARAQRRAGARRKSRAAAVRRRAFARAEQFCASCVMFFNAIFFVERESHLSRHESGAATFACRRQPRDGSH